MTGNQPTGDVLRLERELVWLRWLVAAFGATQVGFTIRDRAQDPAFAMPLAVALVVGLALGNLAISTAVRRRLDPAQLRSIGVAAFVLDAVVISGLIWLVPSGPADPVWVVGYLIPLEGAARWGLAGGLAGGAIFLAEQIVQEAARAQLAVGSSQVAFRAGMAFVIGAVAGWFASSLRRTAARAADQAVAAAAAAARAERAAAQAAKAQGEVAAFHAAVLSDAQPEHLAETLRVTAGRVAEELGCDALGLLTRTSGHMGEDLFTVAGVHGDPGYLLGDALSPVSNPVAAAAVSGDTVLADRDVVAPMRVRGVVVGALHERRRDLYSSPDAAEVEALQTIADQLGVTLEASRLRAEQAAIVERLTELDAMKTDFVAITSHELRTPLAGIRGFVDMLAHRGDTLSPEERAEYLGIVLTQTDRLIRIVDDLLVVSRIEGEALVLEPVEVHVRGVLAQVIGALGDEGARVELDESPGAPATLVLDPNRLIQILTNLTHNALKFSPDDEAVRIRWAAPAEGTVVFEVIDRGPGIPPEEQQLIFERFRQRGDHRSHTEGFGLGLYITKLLAEAMGGWLDVESTPEVGATFRVTLPTTRPLPTPARPSATARSG